MRDEIGRQRNVGDDLAKSGRCRIDVDDRDTFPPLAGGTGAFSDFSESFDLVS
jgi:hypothetical protein